MTQIQGDLELWDPSLIDPSPFNRRRESELDPKHPEMVALVASVRADGLLQPILVNLTHDAKPYIIAGSRRWTAAKIVGLDAIPIIALSVDEKTAKELMAIENIQRTDLHPLDEAASLDLLLQEGHTLESAAIKLGKPLTWVSRRHRLCKLSPKVVKALAKPDFDRVTVGDLEVLARVEPHVQERLLDGEAFAILNGGLTLIETIRELTREVQLAPWKAEDAELLPKAGPCVECPKRSSVQVGLFGPEIPDSCGKGDRCLDATCWDAKLDAFLSRATREATAKLGVAPRKMTTIYTSDPGVLMDYRCEKAKKSDPDSIPVILIDGKHLGKIRWIRNPHLATTKTGRHKKTLQEKRDALDLRRRSLALEQLKERMEAISHKPSICSTEIAEVVRVASVFGVTNGGLYSLPADRWKLAKTRLEIEKSTVWLFRGLLLSLTAAHIPAYTDWKAIEHLTTFLGWQFAIFRAEIARDLPEPKSWAKEERESKAAKPKRRKAKTKRGLKEKHCQQVSFETPGEMGLPR